MATDPLLERILVMTPTGRDAPMIVRLLSNSQMSSAICSDMADFCKKWEEGAGAAIIAEEALDIKNRHCLVESLARQPVWSDFPLVILTGGGHTTRASTAMARALESRGNLTLLERPLRMLTLVSAITSALRARRRQYEVKRLLEETKLAVEQRDQFLATLAHELRNPLAPIRNSLQIMRMMGCQTPVIAQAQEMMERQVCHMTRLLEDLLDVARISQGKIELRKERINLTSLVTHTVEAIRPLCDEQTHKLSVSLPSTPIWVDGDPTRLEQVLTNLLDNACKYTDRGGKIVIALEKNDSHACVRLSDNGSGIPPEKLPKIFDLFVQAERRLNRSQGGLGIGLTLVKKLVELHGGTVEAASDGPGRGSQFLVRLPVAREEPRDMRFSDRADAMTNTVANPLRILVVDDNVDAADSLGMMLSLTGQEIRVAYDGSTALSLAETFRPQVYVLDLGMPGMDGCELARRLRERPGLDKGVLIALTGWGQEEDRRRSREAGFHHHMIKPVEYAPLMELLNELQVKVN